MFILQHSKIKPFIRLFLDIIMKRYLGLERKSLRGNLDHLSLALVTLVLALEFAA